MKITTILPIVFLTIVSLSCKKDDSASLPISVQRLEGKWIKSSAGDNGYLTLEEYDFKSDKTFTSEVSVFDAGANLRKGYLGKQTGNYSLEGDSLIFQNVKQYISPTATYVKAENLEYLHTYTRHGVKAGLSSKTRKLTLDYPCSGFAACIGVVTYNKR